MKKYIGFLVIALAMVIMACGNDTAQKDETGEDSQIIENETEINTEESTAGEVFVNPDAVYADNFEVDQEAIEGYANAIKKAVEDKDIEALADLTVYPVYIGLGDGIVVESKEDFVALGADKLFTEEMTAAMKGVDVTALSPSMAGFIMSDENGKPNIIYSVQEGKLGISGINY